MNERIRELIIQTDEWLENNAQSDRYEREIKFAQLIVQECINTLEFHGFDDAVPYIKWMATNKLGVEE